MGFLSKINSVNDIKKIGEKNLPALCSEIRSFILEKVSETGGHLSSNLGVVELTVALHYCLDLTADKLTWDVGHQAYTHKILTGRKNSFNTLRKIDGLSGFPKSSESEYDFFDAGHSSTSISAALGLAAARDLNNDDYVVGAVIGDGSITGGLAFEGLNNAGRSDRNILIILNDNEMSISKNVGAVSTHLSRLRTEPSYLGAKSNIQNALNSIPVVGNKIERFIEKTKNKIKYLVVPGILFEEIGFNYIGPIDGHNLNNLVDVIDKARKMKGPILLHVITKKGKGYFHAENKPDIFHGIDPFFIETGKLKMPKQGPTFSDVFSNTIVKMAESNEKIVAVTAAMPDGTGLSEFSKKYGDRFFDVGIAEAHAVTFSAGLAKSGFVPIFAVYSTFLQRAYDQIIHDVCLQNLPVVFAVDRSGIVGPDGETHQGIFDLSYFLHIPNISVLAPRNGSELAAMLKYAVSAGKPVAVRYPRAYISDKDYTMEMIFKPESFEIAFETGDICVLSAGALYENSYAACEELNRKGIKASLIQIGCLKPVPLVLLNELSKYGKIFVVEENVGTGGYGSYIMEKAAEKNIGLEIHSISLPDKFIEQGTREELLKRYGLDANGICHFIVNKLQMR